MKKNTTAAPWEIVAGVALALTLLVGCSSPAAETASQETSAEAPLSEEEPDRAPTETAKPEAKAAFVDETDGAPQVERPDEVPDENKIPVAPNSFLTAAQYTDGVVLVAGEFSRGTVTSEGRGVITGAPFVVFDLALKNGSDTALDLSAVVVTMKYGPDAVAAAPVYDDVEAKDFSGTVEAGATQTATYAFQVPADVSVTDLYVDVDGTRFPAHFEGELPL